MIASIKVLSRKDIRDDPSWCFAPIVSPGNQQKNTLTLPQAIRFGKITGVPVLKWKRILSGTQAANLPANLLEKLYEDEDKLTGLFVAGAPGYVNKNLNTGKKIANGTPNLQVMLENDK
eukprot:Lithocolla_globosa_v1_NODE_515_length_3843_cov_39.657075.p5 type:complete len:119 gc:universal NODE_515_length_3843_cov_39.657075:1946-1590(-)